MSGWTNPNIQKTVPIVQSGTLDPGSIAATITPAGGLLIADKVNVSQFASYDINTYLYASSPGAASAPIVALCQLQWFDDLNSGIPVFEEQWWIWVGRAVAGFPDNQAGQGPMHGVYMSVVVSIPTACGSNAILQYFNLFGSPRQVPWSDWRQDAVQVNPQNNGLAVTTPVTSGYENTLANIGSLGLVANQTVWVPCSLYAGPVYYRFQASVAPNNDPVIAAADNIIASGVVVGTANQVTLVNIPNDTAEHFGTFIAPRTPLYFVIHGNAGGSSTFSFNLIAQQGV